MIGDASVWPIPRSSWRARLYCATKFTDKTVPYGDGTLAFADDRGSSPSVRRRLRRLADGRSVTVPLLLVGDQAWCPPFPGGHPVRLTADTAESDGGGGPSTVRPIPLAAIRVQDARLLDPPQRPVLPGLETWTLTTVQAGGTATVTGMLADLATLAAVGRWPVPDAIAEHRHAGAAGHRSGRQPPRPPVRPLGWALIASGLALLVAFVVTLALVDGRHAAAYPVGASAGLLVLTGWNLRRPRPDRDERAP